MEFSYEEADEEASPPQQVYKSEKAEFLQLKASTGAKTSVQHSEQLHHSV